MIFLEGEGDYLARFGKKPGLLLSFAYTDVELLFYAIEKTGSQDSLVLVNYIKGIGEFNGKYENVKVSPEGDIVIATVVQEWK